MVKADPKHQANLHLLLKLEPAEQRRRVQIEDYRKSDYVDTEVLVSVIRARYGQRTGVLDAAGSTLIARMTVLADRYFKKHPEWRSIVNSSSESLKEAVAYAYEVLLKDQNPVSYAEVRFLKWMEARVQDYLIQQIAQKNQTRSIETLTVKDKEGNETPYLDALESDPEDDPLATLEREEIQARLKSCWFKMETLARRAIYFRLMCKYEWTEIAKLLDCSVPTARKYYKTGGKQLLGEME